MDITNKQKHLEFIQAAIARMANNLFYLRGWTITLITALFALFVKDTNAKYVFIVYLPIIIFWILDGYFLSQERLFRDLFNHVRKVDEKNINYSMNTKPYEKYYKNTWIGSVLSKTLVFFYLPLICILILINYLIR